MRPVTEAASTPGRGFCQSTRQPSRTVAGWPVVVSFVVSFSYVRRRPARTTQNRQPRSRTLLTYPGLSPTDLESVLVAALTRPGLDSLDRVRRVWMAHRAASLERRTRLRPSQAAWTWATPGWLPCPPG